MNNTGSFELSQNIIALFLVIASAKSFAIYQNLFYANISDSVIKGKVIFMDG